MDCIVTSPARNVLMFSTDPAEVPGGSPCRSPSIDKATDGVADRVIDAPAAVPMVKSLAPAPGRARR
jgi:hypothetical protein